jgi:hypothetical protein
MRAARGRVAVGGIEKSIGTTRDGHAVRVVWISHVNNPTTALGHKILSPSDRIRQRRVV